MRARAIATAVGSLACALALALGSCASLRGGFACTRDDQCGDQGTGGACEASGYCSFPDLTCASGRRYGAWAGGGLRLVCVGEEPHDGGQADAWPDGVTDAAGADAGDAAPPDGPDDGPPDDGPPDAPPTDTLPCTPVATPEMAS